MQINCGKFNIYGLKKDFILFWIELIIFIFIAIGFCNLFRGKGLDGYY
jgi:hypothetical protein